jgi:hypothetical protein
MNTGGFRNCAYGTIGGETWPVFSYQAEAGSAGKSSDDAGDGKDGASCFWTAQRALEYVRLCATVPVPTTGDLVTYATLKIFNPKECSWPAGTTKFDSELMKDRLPETPLVGMSILGAIHKILEISGEYGLTLRYDEYASVDFYPKDNVNGQKGLVFDLQTSGMVDGFTGICEYQIIADASQVYTGCRVSGSPYQVESSFHYDPGVGAYGYGVDGTLVPGWTTIEGEAFRAMITGDSNNYAQAPQDPASPLDSWVSMDGNDGRPLIRPKTQAALQMARACFPKAYRAFRIPSDSSGGGYSTIEAMLDGYDEIYKGVPRLNVPRMPGPEQLQPYYEDAGDLRGRIRYPVRIRVATYTAADDELHDVTANSGFRITDDGLIWLDGLTDESASYDRIYEGSFFIDPDKVKLRHFFINMWIAGDVRVSSSRDIFAGATDVRNVKKILNPDAFDGKNKGLEFYVLDPDGYLDEQQINSEPSPSGSVVGMDGKATAQPLTKLLRTDYYQIQKHAERRLKNLTSIRRGGDMRFPTIRTDLRAGVMVKEIVKRGDVGGKWDCGRPIKTLKFNYEEQKTSVELE